LIDHLTQDQVNDYCQQRLQPAELLSVSDHLQQCQICPRRIEVAFEDESRFFAVRSAIFGDLPDHELPDIDSADLTAVQTDFVDGKLGVEEHGMVADHLSHCLQCSMAVADLQAFKDQISSSLERKYRPITTTEVGSGRWWQRAVATLLTPLRSYPRLVYGTALTIILLAITSVLVWRTQPDKTTKEEAVVASEPSTAPSNTEATPSKVTLLARLNDNNGELTMDQEGKVSGADNLPAAYQNLLKQTLTSQKLEVSSELKGLTRPSSALMSSDKQRREFSVIEPVGKMVMSDRPNFRWSAMEGATGYIVEVYDSQFNLMASSPQLTSQAWTATKALPRGRVYSWQVKAMKDGEEFTSPRPPASQAKFRVVDQAKANELMNAIQRYSSSHLTLGILYADAGLLTEAEQEFRLLQKTNPDSEIVRRLLRQVVGGRQ